MAPRIALVALAIAFGIAAAEKVQEAVAKDEAFTKLYAHTATFAELTGRNIAVGIDF